MQIKEPRAAIRVSYISVSVEPDHLVTFAVVAKHGSMSAAAVELHRSQPAISTQVKRLNEALGEPVFRRGRRGVDLTGTGAALLPFAQAMQRALEGANALRRGLRSGDVGVVNVAASMTLAVYVLPSVFAEIHRLHPQLRLRLLTRNSVDALRLLERAEAGVALVEGKLPAIPVDFTARTLFRDEIVLAVRPDHPLAARGAVRARDLAGLEIVQREPGSGTREVVESALAAMRIPKPGVTVALEATGIDAVKEAVIQGFGPGFISRLAVAREAAQGTLVALTLEGDGFQRDMTLIQPAEEFQSHATRTFLAVLHARLSDASAAG